MADVYNAGFYDLIRPGVQRSAEVVVEAVCDRWLELDSASSVVDFGCGEGWWARQFAERAGCKATGIDSGPNGGAALTDVPDARYFDADMALDVLEFGDFDLAVCLEVAEHLPAERSDDFVAALCQAAPVVLFSAAVPGQPGAHHINCVWQDVWAGRFEANGYDVSSAIRWQLWNDPRVDWWYRQNMMLAWQPGVLPHRPEPVHAVIHPDFWAVR